MSKGTSRAGRGFKGSSLQKLRYLCLYCQGWQCGDRHLWLLSDYSLQSSPEWWHQPRTLCCCSFPVAEGEDGCKTRHPTWQVLSLPHRACLHCRNSQNEQGRCCYEPLRSSSSCSLLCSRGSASLGEGRCGPAIHQTWLAGWNTKIFMRRIIHIQI